MHTKEMICSILGAEPGRRVAMMTQEDFSRVRELRLRVDKPMLVRMGNKRAVGFSNANVRSIYIEETAPNFTRDAFCPTAMDLAETIERISQHSFYAFESELTHGYITLPGGHRVGVVGSATLEAGVVRAWRYISALNIRVAHAVKGCADAILPYICDGKTMRHTMIISPPGCGKTTLLRDIVRQISDNGITVGLVDERSEVAGCFQGIAQNDVGLRTDVLDGCPKAEGMIILLRAMSPEVIAVDELGGPADAAAVEDVLNAGVRLLCTVHGANINDIQMNPALARLVGRGVFERFIVLTAPGRIAGVYDAGGVPC